MRKISVLSLAVAMLFNAGCECQSAISPYVDSGLRDGGDSGPNRTDVGPNRMDGGDAGNRDAGRFDIGPIDSYIFYGDTYFDTGDGCGLVTCVSARAGCGLIGDGCGGTLFCGACPNPGDTCGGGGVPSQCGNSSMIDVGCVSQTCAMQNVRCGPAGDGCGRLLNCDPPGGCPAGQTCGGGGVASTCGNPLILDAGCTPRSCASQNIRCGSASDGCGGTLDCDPPGGCPAGQTCGGGGTPFLCGSPATTDAGCVPTTCAMQNLFCGTTGDGCGRTLDCNPPGGCPAGQTCGGGGIAGRCGTSACVPTRTTCPAGYNCDGVNDGCGRLISCGTCSGGLTCGGGGTPFRCGSTATVDAGCVATTCAAQNLFCGTTGDGCGRVLDCNPPGGCPAGQTCGGGGIAGRCGTAACVPMRTTCPAGYNCGTVGDGCGGTISCGACSAGLTCGGGGTPFLCGSPATVDAGCVATTCAAQNLFCGTTGDGCGRVLNCDPPGGCPAGQTCGGGGVAGRCGTAACVPTRTACPAGYNCDGVDNGCGVLIRCGTCTAPATCGGAGVPFRCGNMTMPCVPRTCAGPGPVATCGVIADGCGGLTASCGVCTSPAICGGSGVPNQCGAGTDAGTPCMGALCGRIPMCMPGQFTTITGIVTAPGHADTVTWGNPDPLYGVHVYIPSDPPPLPAFTPGVSCDQCAAALPGRPIATSTTDVNGRFTITGALPCGANIPLVVQLGRWRRQVTIPNVSCTCGATVDVTTLFGRDLTRMPRNRTEGDIPLIAIATGGVDAMECVLRKIGIDDTEFSLPALQGGTGRVRFYVANGADIGPTTPSETQLYGAGGDISQYDMVFFPCEGSSIPEVRADQQRLIDYANVGGRVFATHFSYVWLTNNPAADPVPPPLLAPAPFWQTAQWQVDQLFRTTTVATIDTVVTGSAAPFVRGVAFRQWLFNVGASTTLGQVTVNVVRQDFNVVNPPAQRWLYDATQPIHYTFDTPIAYPPAAPIPAASQCGRVVFSDFHVEDAATAGLTFPTECTDGPMTPQEQVLEFMLFDLASCIAPPTCTPQTCASQGIMCGAAGDGCGGTIAGGCGTCAAPNTCGGGGTPGVCGRPPPCVPLTCSSPGVGCGTQGNGCGGTIMCTCPAGTTCGGGGVAGACGRVTCTPFTCSSLMLMCGPAGDGCGGTLNCGACTAPDTCGGGGVRGRCGRPAPCVPLTCSSPGVGCGVQSDGCGSTIMCTCPAGTTCGGGGVAGACGRVTCTPFTCSSLMLMCGPAGDGCGGTLSCGACTPPETCGGGGIRGRCGRGAPCVPLTCGAPGVGCGVQGDGCGGSITCACPAGTTCGGGGVAGACGRITCTPLTCSSLMLMCGPAGDGCGGTLSCGPCTPPETCGGGGVRGMCGRGAPCVPLTCSSPGVGCGVQGDGCGGSIMCPCPAGTACGGGGTAGMCGTPGCLPRTCASPGVGCGLQSDGCGSTITCPCPIAGDTCGGGGVAGMCGQPMCVPRTCPSVLTGHGAVCGTMANGCGGTINCGPCAAADPPNTCGGAGYANECGHPPI